MKMPEGFEEFFNDTIPFFEKHTQYWKIKKLNETLEMLKYLAEALESACQDIALEYGCKKEQVGQYLELKKFKEWK